MFEEPGRIIKMIEGSAFMFEEPGRIIKMIAKVFFWLLSIASIIIAFSFGFVKEFVFNYSIYSGSIGDYETKFNAVVFFSLLIGGPLGTYFSSLLLVGFGELVENSRKANIHFEPEIKIHENVESQKIEKIDEDARTEAGRTCYKE